MNELTAEDRQRIAQRILAVIAIGLVIYAIIWFIFFRNDKQTTPPNSNNGRTTQQGSARGGLNAPSSPSATPAPSTAQSGGQRPSANTNTGTQNSGPPQLASTGPGDTLALFLATIAIASSAHYLYAKHTLAKIDSRMQLHT